MSKKKKTGKKKNDKKPEKTKEAKPEISLEQKIENEKQKSNDTISMMWNYCIANSMSEYDIKRENIHKEYCKINNIQYKPKYQINFDQFSTFIHLLDLKVNKQNKENEIIDKDIILMKMFTWFDVKSQGKISYEHFQYKIAEFFVEENESKSKKIKKPATKSKKGKKKAKKKK